MRIAVLGGGAMGALYGGYLSRKNDVTIVDVNATLIDKVKADGLKIIEPDGSSAMYHPAIMGNTKSLSPVDLVIVFVKAMFSESALENNRTLISSDTYLMTLQNGSGHEDVLKHFADDAHVIIGTTHIGGLTGDTARLQPVADAFTACGLETDCVQNVQKLIWQKMFTNVSASVLTGILQVPLGYIAQNASAWAVCEALIREAVAVAAGEGLDFDAEQKIAEVRAVCEKSPNGLTSIYADLRDGRRSEVDTISGSVVRASERNSVPAPTHRAMVNLVHAMEGKPKA